MLFHWKTFGVGTTTRNHVEVADFINLAQIWILNPDSQGHASNGIKLDPSTFAERDLVLMVIRDRTFRLISDQQCAVCQFNDGPHAMETGHDGRELDIRSSSQVEIVAPVAQSKAARFLAQSEEHPRKVCAAADGDEDVLSALRYLPPPAIELVAAVATTDDASVSTFLLRTAAPGSDFLFDRLGIRCGDQDDYALTSLGHRVGRAAAEICGLTDVGMEQHRRNVSYLASFGPPMELRAAEASAARRRRKRKP